ncbi:MAG: alpha-galactosidase [Blastocatellia bacterium]
MIKQSKQREIILQRKGLRAQSLFVCMKAFGFCILWAVISAQAANGAELSNDTIRLTLGVTSDGIPVIEKGEWVATGLPVFTSLSTPDGLSAWLPAGLIPKPGEANNHVSWHVFEGRNFFVAKAIREIANEIRISWVIELAKQGSLFRLHVRLKNFSQQSQAIDWFPAWTATWNLGEQARWVRWWDSLGFGPSEQSLSENEKVDLGSHVHSSDNAHNGVNPYWIVGNKQSRIHFGMEWSGGWEAKLKGIDDGMTFSVRLPPEETQLVLGPGEAVEGPALIVTPTSESGDMNNRNVWMTQRLTLGQSLYGGPLPSFPLAYNHWYSIRMDVDSKYLKKQVAAMAPYGFDAFILDAGWYDKVGSWQPNQEKFLPGEFEEILGSIRDQGVRTGIWSCPQFVSVDGNIEEGDAPPDIEQPFFFNSIANGYLLDLTGANLKTRLTDHVSQLRAQYQMDWWKYDQDFFVEQSNAGLMRNVLTFQDALRAVRQANPDLTIENCQSGGRMINELTLLATQLSWLRDGGDNGLEHAKQNITTALGALEFIFPWAVFRWTNNLNDMNQSDDELTRFYCRSAMAGVWGVSSNLSQIEEHQQAVILKEIENYRRLNQIKQDSLYELQRPHDGDQFASVTFYDTQHNRAAVLVYRWDRTGPFDANIALDVVKSKKQFRVTDVDTGIKSKERGKKLVKEGLNVSFSSNRMSALVFIEAVN